MAKLVYVETPKDYTRMYLEAGSSCMSLSCHKGKLAEKVYHSTGLLSSCLYAYIPDLKGVCVEEDGVFTARGFVHKDKVIMGFYGDYRTLIDLLYEAGYRSAVSEVTLEAPIKVPGVKYDGHYYCPMPYSDFLNTPLMYSYNSKTHEYTIENLTKDYKNKCIVTSFYAYSTWVRIENGKLVPKDSFSFQRIADYVGF